MRYLILGALLGVLLLYPSFLAIVIASVAALASKPVVVAFGLGIAAGARSPRLRRWMP